jgi:hypothetical protein
MRSPEILAECFVPSYKCRRSGSRLCPLKSVRKVDDELLSLRSVSRTVVPESARKVTLICESLI